MKKLLCLLAILALIAGCSRSNSIQFCEGASPEGKGINCGGTFEDGELTALITSEEPFGVKSITLQIYRLRGNGSDKVDTVAADVRPADQTALVNLSFYTGGTYMVKALRNNAQFSEGRIVIVEQ